MWKIWMWRPTSQQVALRNARHATAVLAQRRLEREEVETYLAALRPPTASGQTA
jgi:hypothetical protein